MKWVAGLMGLAAFAASALATVPPDLTGHEWTLNAINGEEPLGNPPTILFTHDTVPSEVGAAFSGYSGCNRYFGTYEPAPGNKINIRVRGATKMLCEPMRMDVERAFLAALGKMAFFEWRYDKTMTMLSEDGKTRLDFKQRDASPK